MRPPVESRISGISDFLFSAWSAFDGWEVFDGPDPATPLGGDCIVIGLGYGAQSFTVTNEKMPGLSLAYKETILVRCTLWSWSGDASIKARRDRCVDGLTLVRQSIDPAQGGDCHLGGNCDLATIGRDLSWAQQSGQNGVGVDVSFSLQAVTSI